MRCNERIFRIVGCSRTAASTFHVPSLRRGGTPGFGCGERKGNCGVMIERGLHVHVKIKFF